MNISYNYIKQLKLLPNIGQGAVVPGGGKDPKFNQDQQEAERRRADLKEDTNTLSAFQKLILDVNSSYAKQALTVNNVIGVQRDYTSAVVNLTKRLTFLEQRNKELNKTFGISSKQAAALGTTYDKLAVSFGVSGESTRQYGQDLNKLLPGLQKTVAGSGKLGSGLVKLQNAFQQNLGLSGETANNFIRFAGGSEDALLATLNTAQALEKVTGLQGLNRDLTRDLSNLAPQIQLQFSKIPGSLELAVLKARTLGMSFSDLAATGEKLLDVESSVNNELEYQLLSGKRLVDTNGKSLTQQFRQAAITGDANAQADAMNKILETQGDTIENNVFARKKLAETLGIEESKLAGMVQQRKLLKKLGPEAEGILKLSGDKLAAAVDDFKANNADKAADLDKALELNDTRTTDQILIQTLKSIESKLLTTDVKEGGLRNVIPETGTETGQVAGLRKLILTDIKGSITDFTTSGKSFTQEISSTIGLFATATETLKKPIEKLAAVIPVLGKAATLLSNIVSGLAQTKEITALGDSGITPDVTTTDTEDGIIRVNDAVLFNPNDKFNIVASTSPGALAQATSDITGGNSTGPSAQEIGAAVAKALQGVNLYVSPNELAAEMAFNSYNINT